ncbi:CU044_5270 family protein [Actinomadura opuntiae]|uniref:CU044_5270 family protein n=1 Tax=Actinomadura sp. OS1-43 TaxID=604315 RepID=UPI00255AC547|nr:CU044_5270 family protein [Actinomadura sp. OS1-43]MDL4820099.1 CU044_5270 family protein [Actinomadura sp. OS1-43]
MDELRLVERLRAEVPEDSDVTGAERRWRDRALAGPPRRRARRPLLLTGVAAAACGAVAVTAVAVARRPAEPPAPPANVAAVLDRAADRAAAEPVPRPDQFVYQDTVELRRVMDGGRWYRDRNQSWVSVNGAKPGLIRLKNSIRPRPGEHLPPDGEDVVAPCGQVPPIDRPYLGDLPADPDALLRLLARVGDGGRAERQWEAATDLIDRPAPPGVRAALFRAMARIPGVRLASDSVDAAGRHGVAVARTEDGVREEIIFDTATHRYLGTRDVVTRSSRQLGERGSLLFASALVRTAIVDETPEPAPGAGTSNC